LTHFEQPWNLSSYLTLILLFFISILLIPYSCGVEVSLFLDLYTIGRTPWTSGRPVARPLPKYKAAQIENKHTHTKHPCPRLGPHERTKCVCCSALFDIRCRNTKKPTGTNIRVRACLVCWDLLVSFYFYNGRHKVRYNGRILCARVAPA
jgi:hypothetical protein